MRELLLLIESGAIVLVAMLTTSLMSRRSAAERHAVWLAGLAALLLLPLGRFLPASTSATASIITFAVGSTGRLAAGSLNLPETWFNDVWLLGAILCLTRLAVGMARGVLLILHSKQGEDSNPFSVRYSPTLPGPVAWGLGRKVTLLPMSAGRWDEERKRMVLSHEAAHLRRNDCWALLTAELACALFWCNPLVWFAASRLRREQEQAADDEVLRTGADPAIYAGHLVALARAGRPPMLAAGAIHESQLSVRVRAILDPRRFRRMPSRAMCVATVVALLVVALPLASMQAERIVEKIGPGVTPPRPIHKEEPRYTEEAREAKIEGSVTIKAIIEANGRIYDAKVVRSLDAGLDANALVAVRTWVFEPATKNGEPVAVQANIEVNFRLL